MMVEWLVRWWDISNCFISTTTVLRHYLPLKPHFMTLSRYYLSKARDPAQNLKPTTNSRASCPSSVAPIPMGPLSFDPFSRQRRKRVQRQGKGVHNRCSGTGVSISSFTGFARFLKGVMDQSWGWPLDAIV